jgi:CelD/BcsL family acetyltransferase involved in cellulose biosynthesis
MTDPWRTEVLSDPSGLAVERLAWDELAVQASRPYSAPGWALPWWSLARPPGAELRAVAVRDGTRLVGLAPFHVTRDRFGITTWSLLGDSTSSYLEPLATADARVPVAASISAALTRTDRPVDVISFAGVPRTSPWPRLLQRSWGGLGPRLSVVKTVPAPYVQLPDGGYDEWFGSRSRNFRQQLRRRRRDFVRQKGSFRLAGSPDEIRGALEQFERLHRGRWADRGGSQALSQPVSDLLRRAADELGPARMQVWTAEVDGVAVGSAVFLAAGTQTHYWLGGFDEEWGRCSPSLLLLVEAVRHAADHGVERVSLGPGPQAYKHRLATGEDLLDWVDLLPRGLRYPGVRLRQSPYRLYRLASNRTPAQTKQRLRAAAGSIAGPRHRESIDDEAQAVGVEP